MPTQSAADLPVHSIVGSIHAAWYKEVSSRSAFAPWVSTGSDRYHDDAEIDDLIRSAGATVLRVGSGA